MDYLSLLNDIPFFEDKTLESEDELTGVLNRACIFDYINHLLNEKREFAMVEIDIDNFKFINDTFGHTVGDKVIKDIANLLVAILGTRGIIGRYGGDEFVVVFEGDIDYDFVWNAGHKIMMSVNNYKIDEIKEKSVTVTCGISRFPTDGETLDELFEAADKAMCRGKTKGRDCFIIYLPEKHKDIDLNTRNGGRMSLLLLFQEAFGYLNRQDDFSNNLRDLIYFLCNQFMFDHVCIQTNQRIILEAIGSLSRTKDFYPIPTYLVEPNMNASGLFVLNNMKNFDTILPVLYEVEEKQNIKSQLVMKIKYNDIEYGALRVDTTSTGRIWQNEELVLVMTIANCLARDLYYKGISLDDL